MPGTIDTPLFERLGGREAIDAAVDAFHERIARDDRVNHHFRGVDMETLLHHQKRFFTSGTGGPAAYPGREIAVAHGHLSIDSRDFEIFTGHLEDTLIAFEVPDRERLELLNIVDGYRSAVVSR